MFKQKLVHLDLKGAPPKVSFYEQLFPQLLNWGVTGLLIEYEDTFPYNGTLSEVVADDSYDTTHVQRIIQLANVNNLKVIPLLQTFGHLEFLLKHKRWQNLREVKRYPNGICPSNGDTFNTVIEMITQIVNFHRNYTTIDTIHIGADEVWHLAICDACKLKCATNGWTKEHLFIDYITKLAKHVTEAFSLRVIIWDDMLRKMPKQLIIDSNISDFVELMVWHYLNVESFQLNYDELWDKYKLFNNLWFGSAFKGASKMNQMIPPIEYHIDNQIAWINVMKRFALTNINGIAITGWQRFDHYTTLCELLPIAIPSLVMCLFTLKEERFDRFVHQKVSETLGSNNLFPMYVYDCDDETFKFPGSEVFKLAYKLVLLQQQYNNLKLNSSFNGAFTKYMQSINRINPLHVESFHFKAEVLLSQTQKLEIQLKQELQKIYQKWTIDEWIKENVSPLINKLDKIVQNGRKWTQCIDVENPLSE